MSGAKPKVIDGNIEEGSALFELEDSILKKIFGYVDLKAVCLVCKKFNKVAAEMLQGEEYLWLKNETTVS